VKTVGNEPVVGETVPESLAAVRQQAIKESVEGAIQADLFDAMSLPRLDGDVMNFVPHNVNHLQRQRQRPSQQQQ